MRVEPFIESLKDINKRFVALIDVLSALSALSTLETDTLSERVLLKNALQILAGNADLERCSIFILDGDTLECAAGLDWQELTSKESPSAREPRKASMVFNVGQGIMGMAVATGELQVSHDCLNDPRVVCSSHAENKPLNGSIMSVPIRSGSHIVGALNISHPDTHHFNETHERLLVLFSNFLGQLIANWRHVNQMQEQVRQRTLQLEQALSEARHLKERYEALSVVDELTELHNRRFFFPEAQAALASAIRYGHPYGLMILDLDYFKDINDTYGHVAGDQVLRQVSGILKSLIRECDILCRFGGEEFIIALPSTDYAGVESLAARIHDAIRAAAWSYDGKTFQVSSTIGVAMLDLEATRSRSEIDVAKQLEELLRRADQMLYIGKENGRGQTRAYAMK